MISMILFPTYRMQIPGAVSGLYERREYDSDMAKKAEAFEGVQMNDAVNKVYS